MSSARRSAVPSGQRQQWADVAKGASVVLVVLGHVVYVHVSSLSWSGTAESTHLWSLVDDFLQPLRMPVFFAVSGFFAAAALRRPWRAVARARVAGNAYLFVLWLVIWVLVGLAISAAAGIGLVQATIGLAHPGDLRGVAALAVVGGVGPWFLYALALYVAVALLTRRLPSWLTVGAAALIALASYSGLVRAPGESAQILEYGVWFLAAAAWPEQLRRLSSRPRPWLAAACVGALVLLSGLLSVVDLGVAGTAITELPKRLLAVVTGVLCAVLVTRLGWLAGPWSWIGRRTLPVYVLHPPLLFLAHRPLTALGRGPLDALPAGIAQPLALVYPLLLTALLVGAALLVHAAALRLHGSWLFALPGTRPAGAPTTTSAARPPSVTAG